jgi:hypothetical protein
VKNVRDSAFPERAAEDDEEDANRMRERREEAQIVDGRNGENVARRPCLRTEATGGGEDAALARKPLRSWLEGENIVRVEEKCRRWPTKFLAAAIVVSGGYQSETQTPANKILADSATSLQHAGQVCPTMQAFIRARLVSRARTLRVSPQAALVHYRLSSTAAYATPTPTRTLTPGEITIFTKLRERFSPSELEVEDVSGVHLTTI